MWQIVTVPRIGLRLNSAFVPLAARGTLILICASTAVALGQFGLQGVPPSLAVLPAMLLLCVAALASLPLPSAVPAPAAHVHPGLSASTSRCGDAARHRRRDPHERHRPRGPHQHR